MGLSRFLQSCVRWFGWSGRSRPCTIEQLLLWIKVYSSEPWVVRSQTETCGLGLSWVSTASRLCPGCFKAFQGLDKVSTWVCLFFWYLLFASGVFNSHIWAWGAYNDHVYDFSRPWSPPQLRFLGFVSDFSFFVGGWIVINLIPEALLC